MRTKIVGTAVAALALTVSAYANVMFTLGNSMQPDEENVQFHTDTSGTTIFGTTNRSHTQVQFSSTTDILHAKGGQSDIDSGSPDHLIQEVMITVPGHTFNDLIINPFKDVANGDIKLTVIATGGTFTTTYGKMNGQNFMSITTTGGETMSSVDIVSTGFEDLRQTRVSGLNDVTFVPEPSSLLFLGSGVLGLTQVLRRKLL